jgi:hypothetical protein
MPAFPHLLKKWQTNYYSLNPNSHTTAATATANKAIKPKILFFILFIFYIVLKSIFCSSFFVLNLQVFPFEVLFRTVTAFANKESYGKG